MRQEPAALARVRKAYPSVTDLLRTPTKILTSPDIDAVAVITPVWTHYELAKKALENGKHVFVEKPFTSNSAQAEELIELAARKKLTIMVDHTFLFTGAVRKIRELTESGALGDLYYYDSLRVNLGLFQHDVSVIWDLAPHDLSIMDHIIKGEPEAVVATGERHLNGVEDVAFMTIYFPGNVIAHINVNWLSPVKIRMTMIGGQKKMLVWNDLVADEKIRVYDKGVKITSGEGIRDLLVSYRTGDMWAPQVRTAGSAARGTGLFRRLHHEQQNAVQRRSCGSASRANAGSGRRVDPKERRAGAPVSEFRSIAPTVKLGKGRQAVAVHQYVRLRDRRRNEDRRVRRNPEEFQCRPALQDFEPHLRLRGRDHRGQRFRRPRRDVHERFLSARDHSGGRTANGSGLARGEDAREARGFDRLRRDDSCEFDDR